MDYIIQHGLAYFCRGGMFVLLMIKYPPITPPSPLLHRALLSKYKLVLRGSKRCVPLNFFIVGFLNRVFD